MVSSEGRASEPRRFLNHMAVQIWKTTVKSYETVVNGCENFWYRPWVESGMNSASAGVLAIPENEERSANRVTTVLDALDESSTFAPRHLNAEERV
jgi:hypothetical protein